MKLPHLSRDTTPMAGLVLFALVLLTASGCSFSSTSTAAKPDKQDAIELAKRGKLLCDQQRYAEAITYLAQAAAANPGDYGQGYNVATSEFTLDAGALKHGERQVKQMLADRPVMAQALEPGDKLWKWTVRKFAGEDTGKLINWDANDPSPRESDSNPSRMDAWIQLRECRNDQSSDYECDALWSELVFELNSLAINMDHTDRLGRAWFPDEQLTEEEIDEEQAILALMAAEERAIERARAFYLGVYAPRRLKQGAKHLWPDEWHCFRYFPSPQARETAWREDPHWSISANNFKIWTTISLSQKDPVKAWARLQELLACEQQLTVDQRVRLHSRLAVIYIAERDRELATVELDVAERLWPGSRIVRDARSHVSGAEVHPKLMNRREYAERAQVRFERNDITGAVKDVLKAIELSPGDMGSKYDLVTDSELSTDSLHHGEAQVRAMLHDRPGMGKFIAQDDDLWNWAVRRFAGEGTREPIQWVARDPAPSDSRSGPARGNSGAFIQVRDLENLEQFSAADKFNRYWALVAFEFHNLSHGASDSRFLDKKSQQLARDEFIIAAIEQEQTALQFSRMFFLKKFLPYAQAKHLTIDPSCWHCFNFLSEDREIRLQHYRSLPRWQFYANYYDQLTKQARGG